jgi:hypothetical protein
MRAGITRKAIPGGPIAVKLLLLLLLLLVVVVLVVLVGSALTVMPQAAFAAGSASDDFNRANGSLRADWTDMSVGGLAISDDVVIGTQASGDSGDIYTGETVGSDQFSQIGLTSTQIAGGQWIGPAVRAQNGGQSLYVGIYWWNFGSPELLLFKRTSGNRTQLGTYPSGPLVAGTQLNLTATGSTLSLSENGAVEITATDTSLTGGAPAIMAYGAPTAVDWSGGDNSSPLPPPDAPEVPVVVLFPTVAIGLMAVSVISRRRRTARVRTIRFKTAG